MVYHAARNLAIPQDAKRSATIKTPSSTRNLFRDPFRDHSRIIETINKAQTALPRSYRIRKAVTSTDGAEVEFDEIAMPGDR